MSMKLTLKHTLGTFNAGHMLCILQVASDKTIINNIKTNKGNNSEVQENVLIVKT